MEVIILKKIFVYFLTILSFLLLFNVNSINSKALNQDYDYVITDSIAIYICDSLSGNYDYFPNGSVKFGDIIENSDGYSKVIQVYYNLEDSTSEYVEHVDYYSLPLEIQESPYSYIVSVINGYWAYIERNAINDSGEYLINTVGRFINSNGNLIYEFHNVSYSDYYFSDYFVEKDVYHCNIDYDDLPDFIKNSEFLYSDEYHFGTWNGVWDTLKINHIENTVNVITYNDGEIAAGSLSKKSKYLYFNVSDQFNNSINYIYEISIKGSYYKGCLFGNKKLPYGKTNLNITRQYGESYKIQTGYNYVLGLRVPTYSDSILELESGFYDVPKSEINYTFRTSVPLNGSNPYFTNETQIVVLKYIYDGVIYDNIKTNHEYDESTKDNFIDPDIGIENKIMNWLNNILSIIFKSKIFKIIVLVLVIYILIKYIIPYCGFLNNIFIFVNILKIVFLNLK